jgi:hypothetical protein
MPECSTLAKSVCCGGGLLTHKQAKWPGPVDSYTRVCCMQLVTKRHSGHSCVRSCSCSCRCRYCAVPVPHHRPWQVGGEYLIHAGPHTTCPRGFEHWAAPASTIRCSGQHWNVPVPWLGSLGIQGDRWCSDGPWAGGFHLQGVQS